MDAKTAKIKSDENYLKHDEKLINEYTEEINNKILQSINEGKSYYGSGYCGNVGSGHKYEKIQQIVESKFEQKGYRFNKSNYAAYFRWDDEEL